MRSLTLAPLAVATLLAAGCGHSDRKDAEHTVSTAVSGLAKGDAKMVCEQLTPGGARKVMRVLATGPLGLDPIRAGSCREAIAALHDALPQVIRNVLVDGEVDDTKVTGDKATVHVVGAGMTAELQKVDGDWKITGGLFQ
jgi:hypothetical protein